MTTGTQRITIVARQRFEDEHELDQEWADQEYVTFDDACVELGLGAEELDAWLRTDDDIGGVVLNIEYSIEGVGRDEIRLIQTSPADHLGAIRTSIARGLKPSAAYTDDADE